MSSDSSNSFTDDPVVLDAIETSTSDEETLVDGEFNGVMLSPALSDDGQHDMATEPTNVTNGTTGVGHTLNPEARVFTPAYSHGNTPAPVNMAASTFATEPTGHQSPALTVTAGPTVAETVNAHLIGNTIAPHTHTSTTYGMAHGTLAAGLIGPQFHAPAFPHGMNNTHHLVGPFNGITLQNPVHNNNAHGTRVAAPPYAAYNDMAARTPPYNDVQNAYVGVNPPVPDDNPSMTTVTMGLINDSNNSLQVGNVVSSLAIVNYGHTPAERNAGYNALRQLHHLWINPARRPLRGMYYFDGENFYLRHREDDHHGLRGNSYRGRSVGGYVGGYGGFAARGRDNTYPAGWH